MYTRILSRKRYSVLPVYSYKLHIGIILLASVPCAFLFLFISFICFYLFYMTTTRLVIQLLTGSWNLRAACEIMRSKRGCGKHTETSFRSFPSIRVAALECEHKASNAPAAPYSSSRQACGGVQILQFGFAWRFNSKVRRLYQYSVDWTQINK